MRIKQKNCKFDEFLLNKEEDDDEVDKKSLLLLVGIAAETSFRQPFYVRDRLESDSHVAMRFQEGPLAFYQMYRMSYSLFVKPCSLIHPFVKVDAVNLQNCSRECPILTEC